MDATTIVDVITGADAGSDCGCSNSCGCGTSLFGRRVPPAAAFSGSSFLCAAAEITDMAIATVDAEMVITAGSSSFCFFSAADAAITMDAVVDAAAAAATTVDADSVPVRAYQAKSRGSFPLPLPVFFLHFALFLSAVFSVYFSDIPCPVHKKRFHPVPVFLFCRPYGSSLLFFLPFILCQAMPLCHNLKTKSISSYKKGALFYGRRNDLPDQI